MHLPCSQQTLVDFWPRFIESEWELIPVHLQVAEKTICFHTFGCFSGNLIVNREFIFFSDWHSPLSPPSWQDISTYHISYVKSKITYEHFIFISKYFFRNCIVVQRKLFSMISSQTLFENFHLLLKVIVLVKMKHQTVQSREGFI